MTTSPFSFRLDAVCPQSGARAGVLETPHGPLHTPAFMPVGTRGTVKALLPSDVRSTGAECVLGNAYHLATRPGASIIDRLGGLHRFCGWNGPMLTDSGGFQVFSLGQLREVDDDGVTFRSHLDGELMRFTPESTVRLQEMLGADIVMQLDECVPYPATQQEAHAAVERTQHWAERCLYTMKRTDQALFGIVQGSTYAHLRQRSALGLVELDLPGYAIGGLSVGEPKSTAEPVLVETLRCLPVNKPRYLMGVGAPEDLVRYASLGVDMFDCVLPTRLARNGAVFSRRGVLDLAGASQRYANGPIDPDCRCSVCAVHPIAYLAYLHRAREPLAARLASIHNVSFLVQLLGEARLAIVNGAFAQWRLEQAHWLSSAAPGSVHGA